MHTVLVCAAIIFLTLELIPAGHAQSYPDEIARSNSLAFNAWLGIVPPEYRKQAWIASLDGTAGPLDRLTLRQKIFYYGKVCIPHDCGGNFVAFSLRPMVPWRRVCSNRGPSASAVAISARKVARRARCWNEKSASHDWKNQSRCQATVLQIRPPRTHPLVFSFLPVNTILPE
jgi:hypothetical protein